jgi:predicted DNA-binding transcriptional regulator AlpA
MNNHGFKPVPLTKMLYSVIETAAILSYSRQVIYDLINSGQLRAVNPLGSKRGLKVPASEIIRFVDEQIKKARWDSASNGEQR